MMVTLLRMTALPPTGTLASDPSTTESLEEKEGNAERTPPEAVPGCADGDLYRS
jgi:hypothetical protein